jgi:hypothetical protein
MAYDAPPIVSPFYLEYQRYPYIRGANYVRPMFREHGPYGNFKSRPIERILPPLQGLGAETGEFNIPWWCWDKPGFKDSHAQCWEEANFQKDNFGTAAQGAICSGVASKEACHKRVLESCVSRVISSKCPWSKPPESGSALKTDVSQAFTGITKDPIKLGIVAVGVVALLAKMSGKKTSTRRRRR